jgi:hypothetical protein
MSKRTFDGKEDLKAELVQRAIDHRKADAIRHDGYGNLNGEFTGCAVGCLVMPTGARVKDLEPEFIDAVLECDQGEGYDGPLTYSVEPFGAYNWLSDEFSIPRYVLTFAEGLFESFSPSRNDNRRDKKWPEKFVKAIPVGIQISEDEWTDFVCSDGWIVNMLTPWLSRAGLSSANHERIAILSNDNRWAFGGTGNEGWKATRDKVVAWLSTRS